MSWFVPIEEIWNHFYDNRKDLKSVWMCVAEDPEVEVAVYLTEDGGFPRFQVEIDGKEMFTADTTTKAETDQIYRDIIDMYIEAVKEPESNLIQTVPDVDFDKLFKKMDLDGKKNDGSINDTLDDDEYLRRDNIYEVTKNLLETFVEMPIEEMGIEESDVDTIASRIAEILYDEFGFAVYFPTETENGVIPYPFGCFDTEEDA